MGGAYNHVIDDRTTLRMLEDLAARIGVEVRVEPVWQGGDRAGGLCRVHGVPLILLDARAPVADRIAVLCEALAELERDLDNVFMPPAVRARIRAARR